MQDRCKSQLCWSFICIHREQFFSQSTYFAHDNELVKCSSPLYTYFSNGHHQICHINAVVSSSHVLRNLKPISFSVHLDRTHLQRSVAILEVTHRLDCATNPFLLHLDNVFVLDCIECLVWTDDLTLTELVDELVLQSKIQYRVVGHNDLVSSEVELEVLFVRMVLQSSAVVVDSDYSAKVYKDVRCSRLLTSGSAYIVATVVRRTIVEVL